MSSCSIDIADLTDAYFNKTREIVEKFGDIEVTYAIFMRRPVVAALSMACDWLLSLAQERSFSVNIERLHEEGGWVGAGQPLLYIRGSFKELVQLETILLQKIGPSCVAAYNAYTMCAELPHVAFIAMDARHCAGTDMAEMMAYAASIGSKRAQRKDNACGFIGNANANTAQYFGRQKGLGTMPHALIGYAGSTLKAAQMYHETFPNQELSVLVDYFGREIQDSLDVCHHFSTLAQQGKLSLRLDTTGSRFCEGLDTNKSYEVLDRNAPHSIRGYRTEEELRYLIGTGVTAASIWYMREKLDKAGFTKVKLIASSGFSPQKCKVMAYASAPLDVVGTGSFLPQKWSETYATADIIAYGNTPRVKVGREFLFLKSTLPK